MSASRRATQRKKEGGGVSAFDVSPGNFWEVGNYKLIVKKIDEGSVICDELVKMFVERAEIEAKYGKRLTEWQEKWTKSLDASPMYATMKHAALGTLKEASDRAQIHADCWQKIHNQVVETIKRWKESHYHKAFVGWKEAKEYDEEFARAQKQWAVAYGKVHKAKKNYHSACKYLEQSEQALQSAKNDPQGEAPPEKLKKLEDAIRKARGNVTTMKGKYEEKLSRIEPLNGSYENEMRKVFDRWARSEEQHKDFLQETLVSFHKSINILDDARLKLCFDSQLQVAYSGNSKYDVQWFSENFGADMPRNWPRFEEFGERPPSPVFINPPVLQEGVTATTTNHYQVLSQATPLSSSMPRSLPQPSANPFLNGDSKDGFDDDDEWDEPPPATGGGVPVRALYDYSRVEDDELSFKAGDVLVKLSEEDEQGWCRGRIHGREGLYPANYVEVI